MKLRVSASSACPGESNTSCTMGGTVSTGGELMATRCNVPSRFWLHSSHSPPAIVCCPQAHLRCKIAPFTEVDAEVVAFCVCAMACLFIPFFLFSHRIF